MNASPLNGTELDLHRLETPYAQTRVQRPEQVRRLMASIDADGQRVPLAVVAEGERFVLVDGYQRWAALQRLGRDTAQVEVWEGPLGQALAQVLARRQGRAFEPVEQAWLLSAALAEGISQRALAAAREALRHAVAKTAHALERLRQPLQEGEYVIGTATPDHPRAARQGAEHPPDRPHAEPLAPHGAAGAGAGCNASPERAAAGRALARTHLDAARALLRSLRQRGADAGAAA